MTEWRRCLGFPGYEVNDVGQVRSCQRLVSCISPTGKSAYRLIRAKLLRYDRGGRNEAYQRTYLRDAAGKNCHVYVHRLVCEAWHGPRPFPGAVIRHLNDIQTDNRPCNLAWGTPEENREDQIRNRQPGEGADVELAGAAW